MTQELERLKQIVLSRSFRYCTDPPFKLVSGGTSPYYFDCKKTTLDPEGSALIGGILLERVRNWPIVAAGGLTLGADPMAAALMHAAWHEEKRTISQFIVRKKLKDHGAVKWIEGNVSRGDRVLVVDDVVTTGGSALDAVTRAREEGLIVHGVIVLVDREEFNGMAKIREAVPDGPVQSLITKSDIMALYKKTR
jgi:orotate phosphoribosyltransferase